MQSLLKCLIVRNSVVLAVYLLFSVACFFTVHEHYPPECPVDLPETDSSIDEK